MLVDKTSLTIMEFETLHYQTLEITKMSLQNL